MGQDQSKIQEKDLQFDENQLEKIENRRDDVLGDVKLFVLKSTQKYLISKTVLIQDMQQVEWLRKQAAARKANPLDHLLDFQGKKTRLRKGYNVENKEQICSSFFEVDMYFEYSINNLSEKIKQQQMQETLFTEDELSFLTQTLVNSLHLLQKQTISHGYLHPDAIFIIDNKYKIMDPGFLKMQPFGEKVNNPKGYKPPRSIQNETTFETKVKNDVYSLGMILLEAATLKNPKFYYNSIDEPNTDAIQKALRQIKNNFSSKLVNIIDTMLNTNQTFRPYFNQINEKFSSFGLSNKNRLQDHFQLKQEFNCESQSNASLFSLNSYYGNSIAGVGDSPTKKIDRYLSRYGIETFDSRMNSAYSSVQTQNAEVTGFFDAMIPTYLNKKAPEPTPYLEVKNIVSYENNKEIKDVSLQFRLHSNTVEKQDFSRTRASVSRPVKEIIDQQNQDSELLEGTFEPRNFGKVQNYWKTYKGETVNGKKEGKGVLILTNGERFDGSFKRDMVYGKGKFYKLDGYVIEGLWEKNILVFEYETYKASDQILEQEEPQQQIQLNNQVNELENQSQQLLSSEQNDQSNNQSNLKDISNDQQQEELQTNDQDQKNQSQQNDKNVQSLSQDNNQNQKDYDNQNSLNKDQKEDN